MGTVANVTAGKPDLAGPVYVAPITAEAPTDASTALNVVFKSLGFCSDAGLVNSNSPSVNAIKAWGGDTVLNNQGDKPDTFKVVLLEVAKEDVKKLVYGSSNVVKEDGVITTKATSEEPEEHSFVVDMITRGGGKKRIYIPIGCITALDDITYSDSAAVGYGVTISAMPDSKGVTHYEFDEA